MQYTPQTQPGTLSTMRTPVKAWRSHPGNMSAALHAAKHYAKRNNESMIVLPGNSYMRRVYHIARSTDSITRYAPGIGSCVVDAALVNENGTYTTGKASA